VDSELLIGVSSGPTARKTDVSDVAAGGYINLRKERMPPANHIDPSLAGYCLLITT
jgi:hypothetical protein